PIVIAFDIGEQVAPRGIAIGVFAVVDELGFQSAEETLHWRIVPAVSLAAHRLDDSRGLQDVAVVAGGVLGGFKWSSQHSLCWQLEATGRAPLPVFSKQASFAAVR